MGKEYKNEEKTKKLISSSAEIIGAATFAGLSFMVAGPFDAAALGAGGVVFTKSLCYLGSEISNRLLSRREEARIGSVIGYSMMKIQERLDKGEIVRDDGFFDKDSYNRADADEIYEGIILSAQREHEEKKIKFLGNMIANLAFALYIDKNQANFYIDVVKNLTFRQLCILKLVSKRRRGFYKLRESNYREENKFTSKQVSLLTEIYDLFKKNIVRCHNNYLLDIVDINPSQLDLGSIGNDLYYLMELEEIEEDYCVVMVPLLI